MSDEDNVKKGSKLLAVVVVIVIIAVVGTGVALYVHSLPAKKTSSKVVITVAGPSYLTTESVWSNFLNTSMSGWLSTHPNVTIKYVGPFGASTEGQYYTKLDLMTSSPSTAPDIMMEDMFYTATYVNSHTLLPLNNYVKSSVFSNMVQSGLGQLTVNGTHYGIPTQVTDTLIYYNTTLLNESGVHTPWQPHTWQDIINASEMVHAKFPSITPMNIYTGVKGDEASSFTGFEGLLYGTGWGLYNFSAHKWYGENPGLNSTLSFYKTVFGKGLAKTSLSNTPYVTVGGLMQQGKLGIAVDGSWMYGYQWASGSNQIHNFSKYIGVAKIPTEFGQGSGYSSMVGGWGWAAYSGVSNKPLMGSFLSALTNTTNQIRANLPGEILAGGLPATKDASSNPAFKNLMPSEPQLDTFYASLLKYGHFRPPVAGYPKTSYQLQVAMSAVSINGTSVSTALSNYNSAMISTFGSSHVQTITSKNAPVTMDTFTTQSVHAGEVSSVRTVQSQMQFEPTNLFQMISVFDSQSLSINIL